MNNLFVYGTLLDKELCMNIIGRNPTRVGYFLYGYAYALGRPYPKIYKSEDDFVPGALLLDLNKDEVDKLDRYENGLYRRIWHPHGFWFYV